MGGSQLNSGIRSVVLTIQSLLLVILMGCSTHSPGALLGQKSKTKPNILFILTDDLRYDSLGSFGNESISTPHIDRLANQGMKLDRFFVASPVCHASRASFLTGLYPHQNGIDQSIPLRIKPKTPTVASHLNKTDYVTGFVGKSHPKGPPKTWGFDKTPAYKRPRTNVYVESDGETRVVSENTTSYLVKKSRSFLQKHQNKPWFLWLATEAPHSKYEYNPEHPYRFSDEYEGPPGYSNKAIDDLSDTFIENHPRIRQFFKNLWRNYYSEISTLDEQIGRLLKFLNQTNQAQNTIVFLASDNGIMHGSHRVLFKTIWFEEATRVPAIVRWPGHVQPGSESHSLVSSVDFLPTILDLMGTNKPTQLEGRSFLPVLTRQRATRNYAFSEGTREIEDKKSNWAMIRGHRFKYVEAKPVGTKYLYDLISDPLEQDNLISDSQYEIVQGKLRDKLQGWRDDTP